MRIATSLSQPLAAPGSSHVLQLLSAVTQRVAAHFMSPSSEQCIIDCSALHTKSLRKLHKNLYEYQTGKYIHTYIHSYIYTYIHTYIHAYINAYMHTYIHAYLHTYIHTYIHSFIHVYVVYQKSIRTNRRLVQLCCTRSRSTSGTAITCTKGRSTSGTAITCTKSRSTSGTGNSCTNRQFCFCLLNGI